MALLAATTLAAACDDDAEPPPARSSTSAPSTATVTPDASAIPLEGTATAPVRWREDEADDASGAVLAARRFVALRYALGASSQPNTLTPLFAAVTTGSVEENWSEPYQNPSPPPDQLLVGPLFAWVQASSAATDGSTAVDMCIDYGWSGRGTAPTARSDFAGPTRFRVRQVTEAGSEAWQVESVTDPASPKVVGAAVAAACEAWARTHTSPESPA
jgi:hypothetical protein